MSTINQTKRVQVEINGFKVTVFYGYRGVAHLYIMNAEGYQVYAHKVGLGDPLERAQEVIERELAPVVAVAATTEEDFETPERGYVVVTRAKVAQTAERIEKQDYSCLVRKSETGVYQVDSLKSGNTYTVELARGLFGVTAHCACPDFTFNRLAKDEVCKHIAGVYFFERQTRVVDLNDYRAAARTQSAAEKGLEADWQPRAA
jgi:hypothetical protein